MLFSVLIVDARDYYRKGIVQKLARRFDNLTIIGEAADGQEALLKTESLRPDIVILDCQLSKMDGFTYMEQVLSRHLPTHFILTSEFDNFSFVQHALRLRVHDYLLKPINNDELYAAVGAACGSVEEERRRQLGTAAVGNSTLFPHRCAAWANAARSEMTNDRLCRAMAENFSMPFPGPYFSFAALRLVQGPSEADGETMAAVKYAVASLLADSLNRPHIAQCFYDGGSSPYLFCIVNHVAEQVELADVLQETLTRIRETLHWRCVCALSAPCRMFSSLKVKCEDLTALLLQSISLPGLSVIQKTDLRLLSEEPMETSRAQIAELTVLLQSNPSRAVVSQIADSFLQQLLRRRLSHNAIVRSCEGFVDACIRELCNAFPAEWFVNEDSPKNTELFQECRTLADFRTCMAAVVMDLARQYETNHLSAGKRIVAAIRARLENEYNKSIKLSYFAASYYINQSYLSALFQQETGLNYSQYLTDIRLRKAKELLDSTDYSTGRIAELVGYNDRNYFASVFAKKNGMTPMQYRASLRP